MDAITLLLVALIGIQLGAFSAGFVVGVIALGLAIRLAIHALLR